MNTAVVTGTIDRTQIVALALKHEGFDAHTRGGPAPGLADRLGAGSVECYVQLAPTNDPWSKAYEGSTLTAPIVDRIDTLAAVASLLAPDAAVVLVADEDGWDESRRSALEALASAAVVERIGTGRRVTVVGSRDAREIAAIARREWNQARAVSLADLLPGLGHADWRNEIMNLTSNAETTYFGWARPDGARRSAVLRRSVLSPVEGSGGDDGHALARAVLADALGASTFAELEQCDAGLAGDFFAEIIRPLPTEAFELPIHTIAAWAVRRSLADESWIAPVLEVPSVSVA